MKAKIYLLLDSIIFFALLVTFEPHITGEQIHEWLATIFFLNLLAHLVLHWRWVITNLQKFFLKIPWLSRLNLLVAFLMFVAFTTLAFSGWMISKFLLPTLGISIAGGGSWKMIHSLAGKVTLYLAAGHFALNFNWIVSAFKQHVIRPIRGLFNRKQSVQTSTITE
jgi:hypothetical protein